MDENISVRIGATEVEEEEGFIVTIEQLNESTKEGYAISIKLNNLTGIEFLNSCIEILNKKLGDDEYISGGKLIQ